MAAERDEGRPDRGAGADRCPAELFQLERETIRLGDLLKVVYAMSGGEAKHRIQDGEVTVDGALEVRRGKRLRGGELVHLGGEPAPIRVVAPGAPTG